MNLSSHTGTCLSYSLFAPILGTYEGCEWIEDPHLDEIYDGKVLVFV